MGLIKEICRWILRDEIKEYERRANFKDRAEAIHMRTLVWRDMMEPKESKPQSSVWVNIRFEEVIEDGKMKLRPYVERCDPDEPIAR